MKNVVQDAYSQYMVEYAFIDDGNMHSSLTLGLVNMYSSVTITTKAITMTMHIIRNDFVSIDLSQNRIPNTDLFY